MPERQRRLALVTTLGSAHGVTYVDGQDVHEFMSTQDFAAALADVPQQTLARLLDSDPDLALGLDALGFAAARRQVLADTIALPRGGWQPGGAVSDGASFLVVEGFLARRLRLGNETGLDLFGEGDVFAVLGGDDVATISFSETWSALSPTRVAILDEEFRARSAPWPSVGAALMVRGIRASRSVALQRAIAGHQSLPTRLLLLLWLLADRWGRVEPGGVALRLALTHELLSGLVSARRPSVCASMKLLSDRGLVSRRPGSKWLLHGEPPVPEELRFSDRGHTATSCAPAVSAASASS